MEEALMVEEMEGLKRKQLILTFCKGEVGGGESKEGGEGSRQPWWLA